ncbi:hypothetical protein PSQ40_20455, partial [Curvibacter sp. HBC61]
VQDQGRLSLGRPTLDVVFHQGAHLCFLSTITPEQEISGSIQPCTRPEHPWSSGARTPTKSDHAAAWAAYHRLVLPSCIASALAMQLNNLQFKNKSINLELGLPLLIGTSAGGRSDFPFDHQVILTEKYRRLTEDEWEPTRELMEPLLKKMYDATLSQS